MPLVLHRALCCKVLLTIPPLGVQLHYAVHQGHVGVPPTLGLPHDLGIAPLLCGSVM